MVAILQRSKGLEEAKSKEESTFKDDANSLSSSTAVSSDGFFSLNNNHKPQRKLLARHVHLIAIGGSIGTGLFVTIGSGLVHGGPASLLIAFTFWTVVMLMLISGIAEIVCLMPTASPFIETAGRCVDEALEFCAGWNFFLMEACYIPFEITACNTMVHFWRDDYSPGIACAIQIALYLAFNIWTVKWYGESEFYLSITKLLLAVGLLLFTFISMVGGNPQHDVFGFRNFNINPFQEYVTVGNLGKFEGFLAALSKANFVVVGPEYLSLVAGECRNPKVVMPQAFKTVFYRLAVFYIGGALSVGILIACNDPSLLSGVTSGTSDASASPYVIAIKNMGIKGLPSLVNVVVILSAFSAGNSYMYCASRQLYSLAQRGFAPKFFCFCNGNGIPVFAVLLTTCFALLSLLQLSSKSEVVLNWIVNLCTGAQLLNYGWMSITYIFFHRAFSAQGLYKQYLPYRAWFQPYAMYIAGFFIWIQIWCLGYTVFLPGWWSYQDFLFYYFMNFVNIGLFVFWKVFKRTSLKKPLEVDFTSGLEEVEQHEQDLLNEIHETQDRGFLGKFMSWVL